MNFFKYSDKELDYLRNVCPKMSSLIDRFGKIERAIEPDAFRSLIMSVVSQQISVKAAATVGSRLEFLSDICPQKLHALSADEIKACGMSMVKAGYIKNIADAYVSGAVNFLNLHKMPDEQVIKELSSIKGVGVWTAQMLLIFSLNRLNVLSYGDLVIRRNLMILHGLDALSKADFEKYIQLYSPYASVASLYLWEMSH